MRKLIFRARRLWKIRNNSYPSYVPATSFVQTSSSFVEPAKLSLGEHVYIGAECFINCKGGVAIGDGCMVSAYVVILSEDHDFREVVRMPFNRGMRFDPVTIEAGVWLGIRSMILPGTIIGQGAIVAAGSVVTKNVEQGTIVAGNPARVVGKRIDGWRSVLDAKQYYLAGHALIGG